MKRIWVQLPRTRVFRVFITNLNKRSLCTERVSVERELGLTEGTIPFARAKIGNFFQARPLLGNQYLEDKTLESYLKRHIPSSVNCILITHSVFLYVVLQKMRTVEKMSDF